MASIKTRLKNYASDSKHSFDMIQKCLVAHKAKQLMFDYGDDGRIHTIAFSLQIEDRLYPFRLPARVENVERILYGSQPLTEANKEQAYRTAWANIRDWLTAQMALIDTGMVKAEEIFLPYMVDKFGQTYFEAIAQNQFQLGTGDNGETK